MLAIVVQAVIRIGSRALRNGAMIGIAEVRPKIVQTPQATSTDTQPKVANPDLDCSATPTPAGCKAIGFVPQPNATPESAIGTFVLPRASIFVRFAF